MRPDNLFDPVPGRFTAHGRFDDQAKQRMPALWLAQHWRRLLASAGALIVLALIVSLE